MKTVTEVEVTIRVRVQVDESKFTEEFMEKFRDSFYEFYDLDEHREHLAQMFARGLIGNRSFIEGYGPAEGMGIRFEQIEIETETWDTVPVKEGK